MMTILKDMNELDWLDICALDDITPNTVLEHCSMINKLQFLE